MTDSLLVETTGHVRTLTLHRPDRRNALDVPLLRALVEELRAADGDASVRCVVLTGSDPAFTAGLDLAAIEAGELTVGGTAGPETNPWRTLREIDVPVVGAVNGPAVTGGLELALGCDLLIASERARFADTHARMGIHPGGGLTLRLPRAVGIRAAKQMSLTGAFVDAAEAHRLGLVNEVVPHGELLERSHAVAAEIAETPREAIRMIQRAYRDTNELPLGEGLDEEERRMHAWAVDLQGFGERRREVTERGREQAR